MEPDRSRKAQLDPVDAWPFEFVVRWWIALTKRQRVALGIALISIGLSLAYWLPLPHGPGMVPTLLRYGIATGELLTLVGAAVIIAAFPERQRHR
jgi:hypothetical protein